LLTKLRITPPGEVATAAATGPRKITIFLNWDEEIKDRVPVDEFPESLDPLIKLQQFQWMYDIVHFH
jgi:hypothetical protein